MSTDMFPDSFKRFVLDSRLCPICLTDIIRPTPHNRSVCNAGQLAQAVDARLDDTDRRIMVQRIAGRHPTWLLV